MVARLVPALARGLDILELIANRGPQAPPSIATELDLPRTTVHELLKTLEARGYLRATGEGNAAELGIKVFELGSAYERGLDLVQIARQGALEVSAQCGETVHVAILDGTEVVYVVRIEGTHAVRMVSSVGVRLPAHLTAVGKALLAFQPESLVEDLYPLGMALPVMTPSSLGTSDELRAQLETIRKEGLSWDSCESNPDVFCVGAPIADSRGATVAAMSISVPTHRWSVRRGKELGELLRETTDQVSIRLGAGPRRLRV